MSPAELSLEEREDTQTRWPVTYEELAPYYDKVENTLGVFGNADHLDNLPDGRYIDRWPLSPMEIEFSKRVEQKLGVRVITNRIVKHNPGRIPIPIVLGLKTGKLAIRTNAIARHLLIDKMTGKSSGVLYLDRFTHEAREVRAKIVMLCASPFETVRILLNSQCSQHPSGVGGSSGLLGHYVTDHLMYGIGGEVSPDLLQHPFHFGDELQDPYDFAVTGTYIPNFCGNYHNKNGFVGGYGIQCGIGRRGNSWFMLAFGEPLPKYDNFVSLDPSKKDKWGIPVACIQCARSDNEVRMLQHMKTSLKELADAGGLRISESQRIRNWDDLAFRSLRHLVLDKNGSFHPGAAIHEAGGARMGTDPKTSVVNRFCQVWGTPNVFVTDAACFPGLGFQNHTLTIMAATIRACNFILTDYSKQS